MISIKTQDFIKELRTKANLTLQDVANILGVSKAAVSKWETGDEGFIKTEMLYRISKLYGVTVKELLDGKLNSESNQDYWDRCYNLNNYIFDVNKKDFDINAKTYYEHCKNIKDRFYSLLPNWAYEKLDNTQQEEFNYLKRWFKFDNNYFNHIKNNLNYNISTNEKDLVKELLEKNKNLKGEDLKWLLMKMYDFKCLNYDKEVLESKNFKALEYMLSSLSQIEKDKLLINYLTYEDEDEQSTVFGTIILKKSKSSFINEIEDNIYIKLLLNSGANCLLNRLNINNYPEWDKDVFNHIDGEYHKIDINLSDFSLNDWKLYTYQDYIKAIDKNKTNRLKDIVNLKNDNPQLYYKKLKDYYLGD